MADKRAGSAVILLGFEAVTGVVEDTDRSPDLVLVVADDLSWGYVSFENRITQESADLPITPVVDKTLWFPIRAGPRRY